MKTTFRFAMECLVDLHLFRNQRAPESETAKMAEAALQNVSPEEEKLLILSLTARLNHAWLHAYTGIRADLIPIALEWTFYCYFRALQRIDGMSGVAGQPAADHQKPRPIFIPRYEFPWFEFGLPKTELRPRKMKTRKSGHTRGRGTPRRVKR